MRRLVALLSAFTPLFVAAQAPTLRRPTIESLYTLPSVIGTAPRGPAWSRDGKRVAFIWNDEGTPFGDVWMADAAGGVPLRITRLPHAPLVTNPGADFKAQRAAISAELDQGANSVQWTPDGTRVLFSFRGDLWLVNPGQSPVRLTETPGAERAATFATGGARLAWLRDGDVWTSELNGDLFSAPTRVTAVAREGIAVEGFAWAADGKTLSVIETDRTQIKTRLIADQLTDETTAPAVRRAFPGETSELRRVGVVSLGDPNVRWLELGPERMDIIHGMEWSPKGLTLALDKSDVFVKDRRIVLVDGATGTVRDLVREQEPMNVTAEWQVKWAPDGLGVYFTSDRATDYHVWYAAVAGGAPKAITRGEWAVFGFQVTPRGVFVTSNEGRSEERHLYRVPLAGGAPVRVSSRPGTHTAVVSPDGRFAADLFSSDSVPPDLFVTDAAALKGSEATERRVTTSPRAAFAEYQWVTPRYVTFPSRTDKVTLHGRLLLPPGYKPGVRYPVIVGSAYSNTVRNQWGGRNAHPVWGLDQVFLDRGFVVFAVDVAGSGGHGTAFRRRIRLDYGGIDVEDLTSGVEYLIAQGIADPQRVGVWGSSYGGLLTTMALFTKPNVFRAGVAGAPATNVWHALTGEQRVMGRPQEHPSEFANASSHTKAAGMQGSLMLIHGLRDVVVLYRDSAWLTQYLLQMGKDVELVSLPDAPHGWDTESLAQTRYAFGRMLGFFERTLLRDGGR
jgi:dipeptidyl-peptidase-4